MTAEQGGPRPAPKPEGRSRRRPWHDVAAQVRLFSLLLVLCLCLLLTAATYLYGRTKAQLAQELEAQLQRAASIASERLRSGPSSAALPGLLKETGLSRVFLWDAAGTETVVGAGPPARPPGVAIDAARAGAGRFTDFYGDRHQGYYRALLVPLAPEAGPDRRVLGIEARHDLLGALHRLRWVILGGYTGVLVLALVLSALFIRSILRPYVRLTAAAKEFGLVEGAPEGSADLNFVMATFQQATEELRVKEAELGRLYAAERTRADTLERHQRTLLGSLSSGVISFKPDLTVAVCNQRACQIFGLDEAAVLGRPCHEVFGAEITAVTSEALRQQRIFSRLDLSVCRKDGASRRVGLSTSLLKDSEGTLFGLALLLTDLTEILQFREQAVMGESLAALGRLAAGLAHEVRNSLGVIMGYAKLLQRSLAMEGTDRTYLQEIMAEVGALEATLTALLAFAKPLQLAPVAVDLKALTLETLEGFRQAAEEGQVELRTDLPAEEVTLQADPYALRQALGNLIRNALEAMPQGGELAVTVRPSREALGGQARAIELSVQDTGPGIPPEDLDRLFTPFFTRKEGGTGLGLSLVQKTVVAHGGRVSVENRDGGGACFTIRLPLHERRRVGRG